nr:hypothetical protein CFP56_12152 [Quercus suber]
MTERIAEITTVILVSNVVEAIHLTVTRLGLGPLTMSLVDTQLKRDSGGCCCDGVYPEVRLETKKTMATTQRCCIARQYNHEGCSHGSEQLRG